MPIFNNIFFKSLQNWKIENKHMLNYWLLQNVYFRPITNCLPIEKFVLQTFKKYKMPTYCKMFLKIDGKKGKFPSSYPMLCNKKSIWDLQVIEWKQKKPIYLSTFSVKTSPAQVMNGLVFSGLYWAPVHVVLHQHPAWVPCRRLSGCSGGNGSHRGAGFYMLPGKHTLFVTRM